jgi:hypothetical protein
VNRSGVSAERRKLARAAQRHLITFNVSIKTAAENFLSHRTHNAGETVQFGWFVFRIASSRKPPKIESLDFRDIASFTENFSEADRIYNLQLET